MFYLFWQPSEELILSNMLWVILLIGHEDYLLHFLSNFCKSWKATEILLECLRVNGYKLAVLNPERKGTPVECKGLFSYAKISSKDGGAAHSNLLRDNWSG